MRMSVVWMNRCSISVDWCTRATRPPPRSHSLSTLAWESTGNIFSAACKCMAGLGESCSHVVALLFLVEAASKSRQARLPDDVTCTDKTMSWHRPPKNYAEKLTKAVEVSEIVLQKATYGKLQMKVAGAGIAQFEPRSNLEVDQISIRLASPSLWMPSVYRAQQVDSFSFTSTSPCT